MSISKHPPNTQGHYIKSPQEYLIEQNDPNLTHLYLHLANMVNRSDEPKTVTLGGDRRPKVNVRLKKGQCAPSHSKLSEVSTIPESTVKRLLKRLEDGGIIIAVPVYGTDRSMEKRQSSGTIYTLKVEAPPDVWMDARQQKKVISQALNPPDNVNRSREPQSSEEIQGFEHDTRTAVVNRNIDIYYNKGYSTRDTNIPYTETHTDPEQELSTFPEHQSIERAEHPAESKANDPQTAGKPESRATKPEKPFAGSYRVGASELDRWRDTLPSTCLRDAIGYYARQFPALTVDRAKEFVRTLDYDPTDADTERLYTALRDFCMNIGETAKGENP